jgi:hypothetical protein
MIDSPGDQLRFSELGEPWRSIPSWAAFLLRFGYEWRRPESVSRQIAVLSMPCDSAAAGLIALGALVRDLEDPRANDLAAHFEMLVRYARQYIESCRDCQYRCKPLVKGCGYGSQAKGSIRRRDGSRYQVADIRSESERWGRAIGLLGTDETRLLLEESAVEWHIDGQPPLRSEHTGAVLQHEIYSGLLGSASIVPSNLQNAFSGLCLAGRASGESASRQHYSSIRFQISNVELAMPSLLTIHGWSASPQISRISFFNSRTERLDRHACAPALVVSDGDSSFLASLERPEFKHSDVIGVINRVTDRHRLELVGNRLSEMRQWYEEENGVPRLDSPRGINVLRLRARGP